MEEIWKSIDTGNYMISNKGNFRNGDRIIKGSINDKGYRCVKLGRTIDKKIHQLVAHWFLGERPDGLVVDHIDRDKLNNSADNLRYVSQSTNVRNTDRFRGDLLVEGKERIRILQRESKKRLKNKV